MRSFGNKNCRLGTKHLIKVKKMLFQCYEGEEHMLLRVTERIAFFLYDKKIIQKEDIRWCVYLFQKWILNTVSYTILYFIGCYIAPPVSESPQTVPAPLQFSCLLHLRNLQIPPLPLHLISECESLLHYPVPDT